MTDLRQAAQQALVALEDERYVTKYTHIVEAITALKSALEQPEPVTAEAIHAAWSAGFVEGEKSALAKTEQEPFGYFRADAFGWTDCAETDENAKALYEYPFESRQWVGLTEGERNDLEDYCEMIIGKAAFDAIEARLKERNT
jgi:hypothetical protein